MHVFQENAKHNYTIRFIYRRNWSKKNNILTKKKLTFSNVYSHAFFFSLSHNCITFLPYITLGNKL